MVDQLAARWERLPEWARWILFLPCLFITWGLCNLLFRFLTLAIPTGWPFAGARQILGSGIAAAFSAALFFPLLFFLAPRARRAIGWSFYLLFMLVSAFVVLRAALMAIPGFAPEWAVWESQDWNDLAQSVAWIFSGTASFWSARSSSLKPA
jgi:hypothetical protein